mmetsp:Transcript_31913/g.66608  ORF Transcript_31913/g.66608 Transcript_31913/m.66608 type:complete len:84 (-) Transcript_31913:276-527(-)
MHFHPPPFYTSHLEKKSSFCTLTTFLQRLRRGGGFSVTFFFRTPVATISTTQDHHHAHNKAGQNQNTPNAVSVRFTKAASRSA